jgi:putative Holliday junction resolvase
MKIMAVDYGDAHTGLACCDRTQTLASPIGVIDERNFQTCVEKVAAAAVEYEVGEVVVGNPINMNGTYGPRSEKCRMFADMLQNFLEIPVVMWDERSTTVTAHNMMNDVNKRGKERKKVGISCVIGLHVEHFAIAGVPLEDAVAAAVILQNYLDYKANLLAREKAKQEEK